MAEYIEREELLRIAQSLQGEPLAGPLIVRAIQNAPMMVFENDTIYEVLAKLRSIINNREIYIMSTIDGKGCHIGKITGVSLDANDGIVIETDIDSISVTK